MRAENKIYEVEIVGPVLRLRQKPIMGLSEITREIAMSQITAVQFVEASLISPGSLRVIHPGAASGFTIRPIMQDKVEFSATEQAQFRNTHTVIMKQLFGTDYVPEDRAVADEAQADLAKALHHEHSRAAWLGIAAFVVVIIGAALAN